MSYLVLAALSFVQVFALGFQSRNVNHGNYGWALGTSFFRSWTGALPTQAEKGQKMRLSWPTNLPTRLNGMFT